ncbi:MAG: hypothetical protein V1701_06155 [Planctomycetota bacterium]
MNYTKLLSLQSKAYFTPDQLQRVLGIKPASIRVLCSRYVKNGIFTRLKNNIYALSQKWADASPQEILKAANFLQVPSYISFMTALGIYDMTTQVQRNFTESAALKRSVKYDIKGVAFNYYKLQKRLYFGFVKKDGIFIATPEKALADTLYLYSIGKYRPDLDSLSLGRLNIKELKRIAGRFPLRTQSAINKLLTDRRNNSRGGVR